MAVLNSQIQSILCTGKTVTGLRVSGLKPLVKPRSAFGTAAMCKRIRDRITAGLFLKDIIADLAGGIDGFIKITAFQQVTLFNAMCPNTGQTVRHHPEQGFSLQIGSPSLLAELTGIDVIADFRSRDLAAGGQGAPLVPAFHQWLLSCPTQTRTLVNIGGFANLTVLRPGQPVAGFDSGPGNALMDNWTQRHTGLPYDANGDWARQGHPHQALLNRMLADPYFARTGPKSTGREYFHEGWLAAHLQHSTGIPAADVQATLAMLTATTIAHSVELAASDTKELFVCGGGARNGHLMALLQQMLPAQIVQSTEVLGVSPDWMEAIAFAWLAWRFDQRLSGNLPSVTGASGERILGALHPA